MKLLRDANLSPRVTVGLRAAGFDAVPVVELGLVTASDDVIFDRAVADGRVVVTADGNFPMLLALRRTSSPSVIHLRHVEGLSPDEHVGLLVANLSAIADDFDRGAVVSLSPSRMAIRSLPLR